MKLKHFIADIVEMAKKNPALLEAEVYAVDTSSGVVHDDPSIGEREVKKCDLDMSCLDESQIGEKHAFIYL